MPQPAHPVTVLRSLRDRAEMALVHAVFFVVGLFSRGFVLTFSRFLGNLVYRFIPGQRRVALANLELAFGDGLDPVRREALARASFYAFFRAILDFAWFSFRSGRRLQRWFSFDPVLAQKLKEGPAVIVTAHFGNWELLGQAGTLNGATAVSVAAMFPNERLNRFITALRQRFGMTITPREGALRALLKALKNGTHVAFVMDQNTRISEGGVFVNFFGRPATLSPAAAVLAVRTRSPILPVFCLALPDGTYRAYSCPVLVPGRDGDEAALNQRIADTMEAEIRKHPEQWLWMYRRWKYVPAGMSAADFPFYAHPAT